MRVIEPLRNRIVCLDKNMQKKTEKLKHSKTLRNDDLSYQIKNILKLSDNALKNQ